MFSGSPFILRKKCPYLGLFFSVRIFPHSKCLRSKSPHLVRMWENTDQKYLEYGHFLRSASVRLHFYFWIFFFTVNCVLLIQQNLSSSVLLLLFIFAMDRMNPYWNF